MGTTQLHLANKEIGGMADHLAKSRRVPEMWVLKRIQCNTRTEDSALG